METHGTAMGVLWSKNPVFGHPAVITPSDVLSVPNRAFDTAIGVPQRHKRANEEWSWPGLCLAPGVKRKKQAPTFWLEAEHLAHPQCAEGVLRPGGTAALSHPQHEPKRDDDFQRLFSSDSMFRARHLVDVGMPPPVTHTPLTLCNPLPSRMHKPFRPFGFCSPLLCTTAFVAMQKGRRALLISRTYAQTKDTAISPFPRAFERRLSSTAQGRGLQALTTSSSNRPFVHTCGEDLQKARAHCFVSSPQLIRHLCAHACTGAFTWQPM